MNLEIANIVETLRAILSSQPFSVDGAEIVVRSENKTYVEISNSQIKQQDLKQNFLVGLRLQVGTNISGAFISEPKDVEQLKSLVDKVFLDLNKEEAKNHAFKNILSPISFEEDPALGLDFDRTLEMIPFEEKVTRLLNMESTLHSVDTKISKNSSVYYSEWNNKEWFWTLGSKRVLFSHKNGVQLKAKAIIESDFPMPLIGEFEDSQSHYLDLNWSKVAQQAAQQALRLVGARFWEKSQDAKVLFGPYAMSKLLEVYSNEFCADQILQSKTKISLQSLGQKIADTSLSIIDDPRLSKLIGTCAWDAEGNPTQRLQIIDSGVLKAFAQNKKSAIKMEMSLTGNAFRSELGQKTFVSWHNLMIEPRSKDRVDLLKHMSDGFLVESVQKHKDKYILFGLWMELERPIFPVCALVDEELSEWFKKSLHIGRDFFWFGHFGSPSVLIDKLRLLRPEGM